MAVGKGSMDRASRAMKNQEVKNEEIKEVKTDVVDSVKVKGPEKKKSSAKNTVKSVAITKKTSVKGEKEVKATVVGATDQQVLDLVEKTQETKGEQKTLNHNVTCGIGEEMPIYFL